MHIINIKYQLLIVDKGVKWNKRFKEVLNKKNVNVYKLIEKEYQSWWFEDLRTARNYITHHDRPTLGIELGNNKINLLFFAIPQLHQRGELFDQCKIWIQSILDLYKKLC